MDLRKFDTLTAVVTPHKFQMLDWDDEPTDVSFTVYAAGSEVYEKHLAKIEKRKARLKGKEMPTEESDELWIELIANCIVSWENVEEDGKKIEFTTENAIDLLTRYPYFRNEIMRRIADIRAFLPQ